MIGYAKILLAVVACAYLVQVQAGPLDSIENALGFGHKSDDNQDDKKEDEDLYEGGFRKQFAHSLFDAGISRVGALAKEKIDNPIMNPMIDIAEGTIRDKIHHKINDFGEEEVKEEDDAELKEE